MIWKSRLTGESTKWIVLHTPLYVCMHGECSIYQIIYANVIKLYKIEHKQWTMKMMMTIVLLRRYMCAPVCSLDRPIHCIAAHSFILFISFIRFFTAWLKTNTVRLAIWTALGEHSIYNMQVIKFAHFKRVAVISQYIWYFRNSIWCSIRIS